MSEKYGYENSDGDRISVGSYFDEVRINVQDGDAASISIPHDEAPALALAILETARVDHTSPRHLAAALRNLNRHEMGRVEREAERAATRAWLEGIGGIREEYQITDDDIAQWKLNRDYFLKIDAEIVEPRVLNYGDPEPARDTKWRDMDGDVWAYEASMWRTRRSDGIRVGAVEHWSHQLSRFFPMTEVLS